MSDINIQWFLTCGVVLFAAFFLLKHLLRLASPEAGECGTGCSSCSRTELMEKRLASLDDN